MYFKGDVAVNSLGLYDTRGTRDSNGDEDYASTRGAYLPHSCDEWVIGDKEQIKLMIEDLQDVLDKYDELMKKDEEWREAEEAKWKR